MNLRAARSADYWRRMFDRPYRFAVKKLDIKALACIDDLQTDVPNGPLAIIGGNGAGKSTLSLAIAELLDQENITWGMQDRLRGSSLSGMGIDGGTDVALQVSENPEGTRLAVVTELGSRSTWLDPAQLAHHCRRAIAADANFADLLAEITPAELDDDDLATLSYVLGRRITNCEIYEVADYGDQDRFPYFRITSDGLTYSSDRMGFGEICLITLFWVLRSLPRDSIFVLEEPETHVSPKSQQAIMDVVARACVEKHVQLIVTTHSPTVIQHFPSANIWRLVRTGAKSTVLTPVSKVSAASLLGSGLELRGVLLVEDEAAKYFLLALLSNFDSAIYSQFEVAIAGSVNKIDAALTSMPETKPWLRIVGVYDGDQRTTPRRPANWPHAFLPGDLPPESLMLQLTSTDENLDGLATALGKSAVSVAAALDASAGLDGHDWWHQIARILSVDHAVLWKALVDVWLSEPTNNAAAKDLIEQLSKDE